MPNNANAAGKKLINLEEARERGEKKLEEIEKAKGPLIKVKCVCVFVCKIGREEWEEEEGREGEDCVMQNKCRWLRGDKGVEPKSGTHRGLSHFLPIHPHPPIQNCTSYSHPPTHPINLPTTSPPTGRQRRGQVSRRACGERGHF